MDRLAEHLAGQAETARRYFWHRLRNELVTRLLPPARPLALLDVGAGAGLLGEHLQARAPGVAYHFLEPLPALAADLRKRFGPERDGAGGADFRRFDVVTLLDVLEHQADAHAFVGGWLDKLRRGARLIITVPAMPLLWSGWDAALGHHLRYDKQTLRRVFDGLAVEWRELAYLFPEMVPPGLVRRLRGPAPRAALENVELPPVPPLLNEVLYRLGTLTTALRAWAPLGSSLLAVVDKR